MHTVQPTIMIGSYAWDRDLLPPDEYQIRLGELHRVMDDNDWKAVFLYGDAREHSVLAYYTNFVPRVRWALALLPREGEPRLLASMSSRDMPAMKLMTWIPDVRSGFQWDENFDTWIAELKGERPVRVGTLAFDSIPLRLFRSVQSSIADRITLVPASGADPAERAMRPREMALMREACAVVTKAARAMVAAWREGAGAQAAALAAERAARSMAALDVRTLVSLDAGRTFVPFRPDVQAGPGPLAAYVAVNVMGFWAELFVSAADAPARRASGAQAGLDALKRSIRAGATGAQVHAQACQAMGSAALHPLLGGSVGRRIGRSLNEGAELRGNSEVSLRAGSVYALHAGTRDAEAGEIASAMVALGPKGPEVLCSSEEALR